MRPATAPWRALSGALAAAACAVAVTACGTTTSTTTPAAPTPVFASGSETPGFPAHGTAMPNMPGMSMPPATAAASAPASAPAPGGPAVTIDNFAFAPATLTVRVGSTVTWTNHDEEPHTVVSGDGTLHSPGMGTGATYSFTFTKAGTVDYVCSIHPFMHGTVVVTP
ncbi:cupredoxin family copper-binding protein [Nocardia sp. BMG111209]|uniref:cupredoxin domain-containing protein n=1 Tax=Nocardia sp. BMG111209 TaxID=1160137 RepID=UPI000399B6EC|nr:cupredoxin family copper-binding protein [Nocardia sp. BMG111209]